MSPKMKKLYEGKAKIIYSKSPSQVVAKYKDDATAFNNLKKGSIKNKGIVNNIISAYLFEIINHCGIPTHFIKRIDQTRFKKNKIKKKKFFKFKFFTDSKYNGSIESHTR